MRLKVDKDPSDIVDIAEDRSAYAYAGALFAFGVAGIVALVLFFV